MAIKYVATYGSDTTGTGTNVNPYRNPARAIQDFAQNNYAANDIVYFSDAGDYYGVIYLADKTVRLENLHTGITVFNSDSPNQTAITLYNSAANTNRLNIATSVGRFEFVGYANLYVSLGSQNTQYNYSNILRRVTASNTKINYTKSLYLNECEFTDVTFEPNSLYNTQETAIHFSIFTSYTRCTGILLANTVVRLSPAEFYGRMYSNTFDNCAVAFNLNGSIGYPYLYSLSSAYVENNTLKNSRVKFVSNAISAAAFAALPYTKVNTLAEMQAKALADVGAGAPTLYASSFLFVYEPPIVTPTDGKNKWGEALILEQPKNFRTRGLLFKGSTNGITEVGGLVSNLDNRGGILADFTQSDPNYQFTLNNGLVSVAGNEYMETESDIYTKQTKEFTMGVWVKPNPTSYYNGVNKGIVFIGNRFNNANDFYGFSMQLYYSFTDNRVYFLADFNTNDSGRYVAGPSVNMSLFDELYANKWTYIVWTFNNGVIKLYINGVFIREYISSFSYFEGGNNKIKFGRLYTSIADMTFDAPIITEKVLCATEIYNLYKQDLKRLRHLRQ